MNLKTLSQRNFHQVPSQRTMASLLIAKLPADHSCIFISPPIVADRSPLAIDENLHSSFFLIFSIH